MEVFCHTLLSVSGVEGVDVNEEKEESVCHLCRHDLLVFVECLSGETELNRLELLVG